MRETLVTVFEAFDGKQFDSSAECVRYERESQWRRLVGLTEDQIQGALAYADTELAEAIEYVAYKIRTLRLEKGGSKIRRKPEDAEPELPPPVGQETATKENLNA